MTAPAPGPVVVTPLTGLPEVRCGDDLAVLVVAAIRAQGLTLADGDIAVVSSKVVSKALGLTAPAAERSLMIARESRRVVAERVTPDGVTQVVESMAGPVMAAAGVDASNTGSDDLVLALPRDPDAAARLLLTDLVNAWADATGAQVRLGVVVSDTAGRPWRDGQTDFALGAAGVHLVDDLRGSSDADGRPLAVTTRCVGDEIAAAADLVKGKVGGVPVALVRGLGDLVTGPGGGAHGARALVRVGPGDWFALGSAEAVRSALGVEPGTRAARAAGIAPVIPDDVGARVRRALAVALTGLTGVTGQVDEGAVRLAGADPFDLGAATARLCAALRGEGLDAEAERDSAGRRVVVRLA